MARNRTRRARYALPLSYLVRFLWTMLSGGRRSVGRDAEAVLSYARPKPAVIDPQFIPEEGPFVLVANHYERKGLKVYWGGMLATATVYDARKSARNVRWLMTSEWYNFRLGGIVPVPVSVLRWLFRRVARIYCLIIVPRSPERAVGRAAAMRTLMEMVRRGEPIALFPEGAGKRALREAMPGTGALLFSLSKRGIPVVPAGLFEREGVLTARFGQPFFIEIGEEAPRESRDDIARRQVMAQIGRLLPPEMWGPYTLDIERVLDLSEYII